MAFSNTAFSLDEPEKSFSWDGSVANLHDFSSESQQTTETSFAKNRDSIPYLYSQIHWNSSAANSDAGYVDSNLFGSSPIQGKPEQESTSISNTAFSLDEPEESFLWDGSVANLHDFSSESEQESTSIPHQPSSTQYINHPGIHSRKTSVTLVDELTRLFQKLEKELGGVRSEKYDAVKDTFQRDIELLKSKVAELETHNRNDHEMKLHEIDGFKSMLRKISEKIDDMSQIISHKMDELQLVAAKNVISESGRESNTAEKYPEKTSRTMEEVDSSTLYEAEFKSGHLGIIKVRVNLGKCLGEGGFGEVYKIKLPNGDFAAKFFNEQKIKKYPERLYREMKILKKCEHENVVQYIDSCRIQERSDSPVLLMELMETNFEKHYMSSSTLECTVQVLKQVAEGLDYLHTKCKPKIVHRDLTAKNVLLKWNPSSKVYTAKIADFGLSRFVESIETVVSMTRIWATRHYLAPEVDTKQHRYNEKIDVFSFGHLALVSCIKQIIDELPDIRQEERLYLTEIERRATHFGDLQHKLHISSEEYQHDDLKTLIKSCLEMNHKDRPTAAELIEKLSQILKHFSASSSDSSDKLADIN